MLLERQQRAPVPAPAGGLKRPPPPHGEAKTEYAQPEQSQHLWFGDQRDREAEARAVFERFARQDTEASVREPQQAAVLGGDFRFLGASEQAQQIALAVVLELGRGVARHREDVPAAEAERAHRRAVRTDAAPRTVGCLQERAREGAR